MNKFYKRFAFLILLVLVISGIVIYTTVDINTLHNLDQFQPWSIALAVLAVSLGLFFDGSRLMHMVKISNEKITLYQAVQVVFGNYFLALLTPGATGGAVAQLMFLRHAGVPTGKATVLVIVRTLLSILFLVLCMPFIFLHDAGILPGVSNQTLMAITLTAFVVIIGIVFGARRGYLDYVVVRLTKRMKNERRRKIFAFYRDTKCAISLLAQSPKQMLVVFAESGLNLLCIYAIVPCLLLGLGVMDADWYTVMGRMIFLNMLLYFTPTPGGSGIAEGGFVLLLQSLAAPGTVGVAALAWRVAAEYIPFGLGAIAVVQTFGRDFMRKIQSA